MPKIRIKEIDNTGRVSSTETPNVVYIPGPADEAVAPVLFTSASLFKKAVEDGTYAKELSAKMAYHLLTLGMHVLYEGVEISDETGEASIDWDILTDKNLYNVRFLTTGQFFQGSQDGVNMIKCAATRCDAVALIDIYTENNDVDEYRDAIDTLVESAGALEIPSTLEPATFAAAFAPTWSGNINGLDDTVEKIDNLPPSFAYLCAFARSVRENPMWYAVAGSFRGVIPELTAVAKEYNSSDIEMLQARSKDVEVALDDAGDNVGIAINPIAYRRPFGHLIWGNRTLRDNEGDDAGVGITKATSFLNCRILATEVAKVAFNAANKYTFEQNSEILWTNFTSYILPTLDRMSTGNGILDYKIIKVPTNKKARLCAKISLIPIEAVEDFDITIELTDEISVTE